MKVTDFREVHACKKHPEYRLLKEPWTTPAKAIDFAKTCDYCAAILILAVIKETVPKS